MDNVFIFIVTLTLVLSTSCDKEVDILIPESEIKLVANSIFTPDSTFKVYLYKSNSEDSVTNALIEIYQDNELIDNIEYCDSVLYKSNQISFEERTVYSLNISVPGFPLITASDSIPSAVPILEMNHFDSTGINTNQYVFSSFELSFKDPAEERNFYEISILREADTTNLILRDTSISSFIFWGTDWVQNSKEQLYRENLRLFSPDQSIVSEGFDEQIHYFLNQETLFFSDELFNGEQKYIQVNYLPYYSGFRSFYYYVPTRKFTVHLRSISENYYKFRKSEKAYFTYKEQFELWKGAGDYVQIYSNIENGYGLFAGYSTSIDSIVVINSFEK
jgi:hypothetical protein